MLFCLQGMGQDQIAQELGIKRPAVAGNIRKGRRRLERELGRNTRGDDREGFVWTSGAATGWRKDPLAASLIKAEAWLREALEEGHR